MQDIYVKERDRKIFPEEYKWNLTDIYPDDEAWKKAKARLLADFSKIQEYRGQLSASASQLFECLDLISRFGERNQLGYLSADIPILGACVGDGLLRGGDDF